RGQNVAVNVPLLAGATLVDAVASFHGLHERLYGYAVPGEPVETVNLCVQAVGRIGVETPEPGAPVESPARAVSYRDAFFGGGTTRTPVFERDLLAPGSTLAGPAIVESDDATICVPPGAAGRVDAHG